jgi:hypothetical protein
MVDKRLRSWQKLASIVTVVNVVLLHKCITTDLFVRLILECHWKYSKLQHPLKDGSDGVTKYDTNNAQ